MKLSCMEMMLGDRPLAEKFALAQASGFDGIDLRGDLVRSRVRETQDLIRQTGLAVPTVYGRLTTPLLSRTVKERMAAIDLLRGRISDAAEVGAGCLVVVPIFWDARITVDRGHGVEEIELGLLMVLLNEVKDEAEAAKVRLVLEPLNRGQTHLLVSPTKSAELTRALGSAWIGTMVDTYHMDLQGQDAVQETESVADQLHLVHLSDRGRQLPGTGGLDFGPILRTVESLGYAGYLGFECAGTFEVDDLRASMEWVRSRLPVD